MRRMCWSPGPTRGESDRYPGLNSCVSPFKRGTPDIPSCLNKVGHVPLCGGVCQDRAGQLV